MAFVSFSLSGLLLTPRSSFKADWNASVPPLCWRRSDRESNVKPRESSFLACVEVSVGFPMALISDAALMKILFCCIHSLVCSWGNLMERAAKCGLMSWCLKTLSIANTSGRALCAPTIYTNNYIICNFKGALPATSSPVTFLWSFSKPKGEPCKMTSPSCYKAN